MEPNHPVTI